MTNKIQNCLSDQNAPHGACLHGTPQCTVHLWREGTQEKWFNDMEQVVEFGEVLLEHGQFDDGETRRESLEALQYYYAKPWKWTDEHERWVALGKPAGAEMPEGALTKDEG